MAYFIEFDATTGICLAIHETEGEVRQLYEGSVVKEVDTETAQGILNGEQPLWLYKLEPTGEIRQLTNEEYLDIVAIKK